MKSAIAATAILALIGSQTLAAETALPAGKPAGVQQAQRHHRFPLLLSVGIAAVVAAGVVIAIKNSGDSSCGSACSATSTAP